MKGKRRLYLQSPVGNRTPIKSIVGAQNQMTCGLGGMPGWSSYWYGTGTMALAMAAKAACIRAQTDKPRIALAAYGCPDLVAAIHFAGAEPLYVDLEPDSLNMNLTQLHYLLEANHDICAVIGTDLFGTSENWVKLRESCSRKGPLIIQDCAQSLQGRSVVRRDLHGDMVIFSFGRGKPVCLLGGGTLLVSDSASSRLHPEFGSVNRVSIGSSDSKLILSLACYNLLINPRLYSIAAAILGERLGETRFTPLERVERLSDVADSRVDAAVEWFWSNHNDKYAEVASALVPVLQEFPTELNSLVPPDSINLPDRIYIRMPLLARSAALRDDLVSVLVAQGISASAMYKRVLPDIVKSRDSGTNSDDYPVARSLAGRLFTLPVHNRMTDIDLQAITNILCSYFRECGHNMVTV